MQRRKKSKKGKRKVGKEQFRQQVMSALAFEGKEKITVTRSCKPPKPIHSQLQTRQVVNAFGTSTGIQNGSSTQGPSFGTGSTAAFGSVAFELNDIDDPTSYSSVFDQYRIDRVVFQLRSRNKAQFLAGTATANAYPPPLYLVIDRDDSTAPASLAALREYDNCVEVNGDEDISVDLEPSITPAIYAGGAFSGYGVNRVGQWLDIANATIPHYGVKFGVASLNVSTTYLWEWDIFAYYYLSFRNVR